MEKDKIATLLKSWSKTQQLRIANISKLRVRVVRGNQKYYGNINFTSSLSRTITTVSTLLLLTLRECTKLQPKGSSLCQSRKMNVQIFFADTSDECTDSSFEEEKEPCPPTPQNNYDKILL
ncbi:hypothetical protein MTP99_003683 [Tenebrio molitor]|nr:hypothetical protein MTP99_003683 [Tenebrio molitor]